MRRWGPAILVTVAVAYGVALRWWGLGTQSLWFDEGYTAWVVSLPSRQIVRAIRVDTAPPLYYLLLHAWAGLAGTSEAALRAPSAACATAALGVVIAVVRRLYADRWARAAAVSLAAVSFLQVAYAHEVRFYAAMSLAGVVDLYLVLRASERDRRSPVWLAATATAWAVSLWLNNIMIVYLGCLAAAWLVAPGRRPIGGRVADIVVVAAVAGLAFAPWVPSLLGQMRAVEANFWSHPPSVHDGLLVVQSVGGLRDGAATWPLVLTAIAVAAAAVRVGRTSATLALFGLLPIALAFAYSRGRQSIFMDRAFIVSSLVVPLLAAVPLEATARVGRRVGWRVAAGVVVGGLAVAAGRSAWVDRYRTPDHDEDWRAACRFAAEGRPELVVFNALEGELLFDYYARGGHFGPTAGQTGTPAGYFDADPPRTLRRVRTDADLDALRRRLDSGRPSAVVFVAAHADFADVQRRTLAELSARMSLVGGRRFPAVTVYRFAVGRR